jgi:hypothetical protein
MGDKDPIDKAHRRETKKDTVKLREAPKLMHFQVSSCNFIMCNVSLDFSRPFKCEHVLLARWYYNLYKYV